MRVDAHQHFWRFDGERDDWITDDMAAIRRDFMPADLRPILAENGFDCCVAVQADQSEAETEFLLGLAEQHTFIRGVVGWLDLRSDTLEERIDSYASFPVFKGVRHVLQAEAPGFMSDPKFVSGVAQLGAKGLSYDILTTEAQLPELCSLVEQLPEMALVVDHISKPNIKAASFDDWAKGIQALSRFPHVRLKLSGMATEADWQHWKTHDIQPYVDFALEHFGPSRLMFGSDWPVCLLAGSYSKIRSALCECISHLPSCDQEQIMGGTARAFYRIS